VWRYSSGAAGVLREARNVTDPAVLADVASQLGIARADFAHAFASQKMRDATLADFQQSQDWGIRGFPTRGGASTAIICTSSAAATCQSTPCASGWPPSARAHVH